MDINVHGKSLASEKKTSWQSIILKCMCTIFNSLKDTQHLEHSSFLKSMGSLFMIQYSVHLSTCFSMCTNWVRQDWITPVLQSSGNATSPEGPGYNGHPLFNTLPYVNFLICLLPLSPQLDTGTSHLLAHGTGMSMVISTQPLWSVPSSTMPEAWCIVHLQLVLAE